MQYVISDTHFDHGNIIGYCDRPFKDVGEMNETLIENWNDEVDQDDVVYFLGDLSFSGTGRANELLDILNGNIVLVQGNHDEFSPADVIYPVVNSAHITAGKYRFGCVHNPEDELPPNSDWVLHGHTHNNSLSKYPFVNKQMNTVNVSVELVDYRPISLPELTDAIDSGQQKFR